MLSPRWINLYGYFFLIIVAAMLALVWFQLVPRSMYVPLFMVALVLYLIRITLRLLLERQRRLQERGKKLAAESTSEEKDQ